MKILVLGATGGTGKHLVELALAAGHDVTALVRDPAKLASTDPRLKVVKGVASSVEDLERVLPGHDAVLSTLGPRDKRDPIVADTAVAVTAAMKKTGVRRIVWLSASGVGDSIAGAGKASFVFAKIVIPLFLKGPYANHARAEETLRGSGLDWTVLRPLQLVDAPAGRTVVATPPDEKPATLKIARRDVGAFMLEELAKNAYVGKMPMIAAAG